MAAGAAAAPAEAPGAAITIGLWLVAALLLGIAAERIWNYTFGALLHSIAQAGKFGVWKIKINLGGPADAVNNAMTRALGEWILANEKALGLWWHAVTKVVEEVADTIYDMNASTYNTLHSLVFGTIPRIAGDAVAPWREETAAVGRTVRVVRTTITRQVVRVARAQTAALERDFGIAFRGIDHLRTKAIPRLWHRVTGIGADVADLRHRVFDVIPHRLSRLEKALAAGALGAVAIAAMTRVFPYWQCSAVRRFNRLICRSPLNLLDDVLGLLLATTTAFGIIEFAKLLQDVAEPIGEGVLAVVDDA